MNDDINELDKQIQALKEEYTPQEDENSFASRSHPAWLCFNLFSEFMGGLGCGMFIGYLLDKHFETRPIFMIAFLIIGSIVGILNVIRGFCRYEQKKHATNKE